LEQSKQVGVRASIARDRLRIGRRRTNRLRLLVRSRASGTTGRASRQIIRLRFRATDADDRPPVAIIVPESEAIFPDLATGFDASRSFDPDSDVITYQWDFGDGVTSTDIAPQHTYASADQPRTVTLTVSDGQMSSASTLVMRSCPQPVGVAPGSIQ